MKDCPAILFVGLSATPWARGLGKYYDDLIVEATTADLIREGYLSPFLAFAPSEPDLAGVRTVAGDFHETQLAEAVDQPKLVGDVIETWLKRGENRPTLCYGVNRAYAEHLQQRFVEVGVAAEYIDCFTDRLDRERIFDRFRAGETRVICNVATLAVGLDLPMTSCIIDARPTKSEIRFVQTIGRGLRTAPAKQNCLILDHAGNHLRLGMVTLVGTILTMGGSEKMRVSAPVSVASPCRSCVRNAAPLSPVRRRRARAAGRRYMRGPRSGASTVSLSNCVPARVACARLHSTRRRLSSASSRAMRRCGATATAGRRTSTENSSGSGRMIRASDALLHRRPA